MGERSCAEMPVGGVGHLLHQARRGAWLAGPGPQARRYAPARAVGAAGAWRRACTGCGGRRGMAACLHGLWGPQGKRGAARAGGPQGVAACLHGPEGPRVWMLCAARVVSLPGGRPAGWPGSAAGVSAPASAYCCGSGWSG